VLAAGAWSGAIRLDFPEAARLLPPTFPVRGHLSSLTMEPGFLGPILRHGHTYLLQRGTGELVIGASQEHAGFDRVVDPGTAAGIWQRASGLITTLASLKPEKTWVGFRPATSDFKPRVRRLGKLPIWIATGHYRNGILLAPATARIVSRDIISS
jgi:glycine oxidase